MNSFLYALITATLVHGAGVLKEFTETKASSTPNPQYEKYQKALRDRPNLIMGSARQQFSQFTNSYWVPGFMSSSAIPEIAQIIGPTNVEKSYRVGDTVYLRWYGTPGPREGQRYAIYTPAIVLQNMADPTDFTVSLRPEKMNDLPSDKRMAGYFYESNGELRITQINQGVVQAVLEKLRGQVSLGDKLMQTLPVRRDIKPMIGGIQLAAAVVAGSPWDRISSSERSFIYINRGSRDGIREGRIFEAVEDIKLNGPVTGLTPQVSNGEAMVVFVSDSYSTAVITRQFDGIRLGALLKTKQELTGLNTSRPFENLNPNKMKEKAPDVIEEVPDLDSLRNAQDQTLPDPTSRRPRSPPLSDLDAMERGQKFDTLSTEERSRLGKLSKQEKIDSEDDKETDAPAVGPVDNSFKQQKKPEKKKKKVVPGASDEEELNQLMMQN